MKAIKNPLRPGTVIRTHPKRGYWGCAIVLTARDGSSGFHPSCHIATTPLIRRRKYSWASVQPSELQIVRLTPNIRVGPNEYRQAPGTPVCIGIYTLKHAESLDIIGEVDPTKIYEYPLTFEVGDGTSGRFSLCGPISDKLGWEAVVAWRELNDRNELERERKKSREQFEAFERERLAAVRTKRKIRNIT